MIQFSSKARLTLAAVGLLAVGGAAGAVIDHAARPVVVMPPATPTRIAALADAAAPGWGDPIAAVRGRVAERYGDRFVLDDGSGRALVEMGREGGGLSLARGQVVTVQGRARDGVIRAMFVVGPDGRAYAMGPGGPGRRHDGGPEHDGPDHRPAPATPGEAARPG